MAFVDVRDVRLFFTDEGLASLDSQATAWRVQVAAFAGDLGEHRAEPFRVRGSAVNRGTVADRHHEVSGPRGDYLGGDVGNGAVRSGDSIEP